MKNVQYIAPLFDHSGYGEAARHDVMALLAAGVKVTTIIPQYVMDIADFGDMGRLIKSTQEYDIPFEVKIIHTTPDQYLKYIDPTKYNIGRVFWETSRLPEMWVTMINQVQEVWTGSEHNKQSILNSGVKVPVYVIPQAHASDPNLATLEKFITVADDKFRFYSIFEWTERKNPRALLTAFYKEFTKDDKVALVLKTYVDNFTHDKKDEIRFDIHRLKDELKLDYYAPVYLYQELMDRKQIYQFHKTNDVFVSAHRGEGWGIPQVEAMSVGNCIISSNCGGVHEYLEHKKNALLVGGKMVKLSGNTRNQHWYAPTQEWFDIDIDDLRANMRWALTYKDKSTKKIGETAKRFVENNFNFNAIGTQMRTRLEAIK